MSLESIHRILHDLFTYFIQEARKTTRLRAVPARALLTGFTIPLFLLATLVWIPDRQAIGQTNLASITGSVTDSTGAAIPNVSVSILNTDTIATRVVTTDANGFYTAPSLSAARTASR